VQAAGSPPNKKAATEISIDRLTTTRAGCIAGLGQSVRPNYAAAGSHHRIPFSDTSYDDDGPCIMHDAFKRNQPNTQQEQQQQQAMAIHSYGSMRAFTHHHTRHTTAGQHGPSPRRRRRRHIDHHHRQATTIIIAATTTRTTEETEADVGPGEEQQQQQHRQQRGQPRPPVPTDRDDDAPADAPDHGRRAAADDGHRQVPCHGQSGGLLQRFCLFNAGM
jgi:hypothetical protein